MLTRHLLSGFTVVVLRSKSSCVHATFPSSSTVLGCLPLVNCLISLNNGHEAATVLPRIIEAAADPRDFVHDPDRHSAVCDYLNRALRFDGFELQNHGGRMRLIEAGKGVPVLTN